MVHYYTMYNEDDYVILKIKYKVREQLKDIGTKRETYSDIIERLINTK